MNFEESYLFQIKLKDHSVSNSLSQLLILLEFHHLVYIADDNINSTDRRALKTNLK